MKKKKQMLLAILFCAAVLSGCGGSNEEATEAMEPTFYPAEQRDDTTAAAKPVIYLYPEQQEDISVQLLLDGDFTCTYPTYETGWQVTASPDGQLLDADGQEYNYLYWEGDLHTEYDFSEGFCVAGENTAAFLEDALAQLGLSRREANEYIVYWLPRMQDNAYNLISFQTEAYTDHAQLIIDPKPDTVIRVFMAWKPLEEEQEIPAQDLSAPERAGFTVVEWGGCEIAD
ncbi:MAG: hypothetical protein ACI4PM_00430 [Butyricicoccus sp.]